MTIGTDERARLEAALTRAELPHRIEVANGRAFAHVERSRDDGRPQRYVVTWQGGVLGVCAPGLRPAPPRVVNALNRAFLLGRVYLTARPDLSAAVSFHATDPDTAWAGLLGALWTLHGALDFVEAGTPPPLLMPPSTTPPLGMAAVGHLLRQLGHDPQPAFGGELLGLGLRDEDGTHLNVELAWTTDDLLMVRAIPAAGVVVPDPDRALAAIQEVNARVGFGTLILDEPSGRAAYVAHVSRFWVPLTTATVDWHLLRAVGAMTALHRRLRRS